MKIKLFPFQSLAVENLRLKADYALRSYRETHTPQVVSLQAPTGSGKTVMMTAFIENILFGDERHDEMSNAVFVWLSDSPALNEQSKEKIELKSDKIQFGRCVTVEDASFGPAPGRAASSAWQPAISPALRKLPISFAQKAAACIASTMTQPSRKPFCP